MTTISTPAATHSTKKIYTVDSFEAIAGGTDWRCFRTNAQRPLGHRQGYGVTVDRGRGSRGPLAPSGADILIFPIAFLANVSGIRNFHLLQVQINIKILSPSLLPPLLCICHLAVPLESAISFHLRDNTRRCGWRNVVTAQFPSIEELSAI